MTHKVSLLNLLMGDNTMNKMSLAQLNNLRKLILLGHTVNNLRIVEDYEVRFTLESSGHVYRMVSNGDCFNAYPSPTFTRETLDKALKNKREGRS